MCGDLRSCHSSQPRCAITTRLTACSLAYNYFHPGADVPLLLRYVEDKDIWR